MKMLAATLGCVALLLAGPCLADGMMVPVLFLPGLSIRQREAVQMVESPRQEAVMIVRDGMVRVVLRTHFHTGPEELAWVVPVPATPKDIHECDDAVFDALDELTAPKFYREIWGKFIILKVTTCGAE